MKIIVDRPPGHRVYRGLTHINKRDTKMQSVETVKRTILVKIKQVYGNKTVYPVSDNGKLILLLTGTSTFTPRHISTLKTLGYTFQVQADTL
jgi:hypothetical protein